MALLFGEAPGFLLIVDDERLDELQNILWSRGVDHWVIGRTLEERIVRVMGAGPPFTVELDSLAEARASGLELALH